ncbi:ARL14 effector protein [Taenia crassiceps]|uniref:ARL14 effector protein n=1 Tax=Taenia crassiceps TaxID=6207 RepID=A0ABR4QF83_9CEST
MAEQVDVNAAAGVEMSVSKSQTQSTSLVTDAQVGHEISSAHPSANPTKSSNQNSENNYRPTEVSIDSTIPSVNYSTEDMRCDESTDPSLSASSMPYSGKSVLSDASSISLSTEKRKKKQVCRKSTASAPSIASSELESRKHHTWLQTPAHNAHTGSWCCTSASTAAELDRLRFINPGRQNTDLKPINWMQEGVYMTRGHRRQMELHAKLCEANSSDPPLYDSRGLLLSNMQDRCDCMRPDCPGCFLPCRRCHTTKCGPLCRILRNFHYEKAELYI